MNTYKQLFFPPLNPNDEYTKKMISRVSFDLILIAVYKNREKTFHAFIHCLDSTAFHHKQKIWIYLSSGENVFATRESLFTTYFKEGYVETFTPQESPFQEAGQSDLDFFHQALDFIWKIGYYDEITKIIHPQPYKYYHLKKLIDCMDVLNFARIDFSQTYTLEATEWISNPRTLFNMNLVSTGNHPSQKIKRDEEAQIALTFFDKLSKGVHMEMHDMMFILTTSIVK